MVRQDFTSPLLEGKQPWKRHYQLPISPYLVAGACVIQARRREKTVEQKDVPAHPAGFEQMSLARRDSNPH